MISYCITCYRPKYDVMLIEDLIRKTTVPYEILTWINTPDRSIVDFIGGLSAKGIPIRVVGDTPENIGMNAFKKLFLASQYELITQLDDDVLRVSPGIAEKCLSIFRRRREVKYLVADTWIDEYTNGNRPGMGSYKAYAPEDGLYDGPIDSWYGVYHRSILPVLMQAPYEKYFYLGSFVRGILPRFNQIGCLCTKFKVFHGCGPAYHYAFGLLDHEIGKFNSVNMKHMADAYEKARAGLHPAERILAKFEVAKQHIDTFGVEEMSKEEPSWDKVKTLVQEINAHYGIHEHELKTIFDLVKDCAEGSVIVEIGVCHGRTAAMLAYVAQLRKGEYHGIDQFGFDGSTKEGVEEKLFGMGLMPNFYQGDSNVSRGRPLACPVWNKPIDILFIDGGHDEPNVRGDCEMWIPRLAPKGLIIFDDWNDGEPHTNAHWAIKHYSEEFCKGWDVLLTGHKLHIRRKPAVSAT